MENSIEVKEICNIKTGFNCIFVGDSIVKTRFLTTSEIIEKYKDYMTEKQLNKLKKL